MFKKILIGLGALVGAFLIYVAFIDSGEFKVRREIAIHAPPEVIFANVSNLHKFDVWNPFPKADPKIVITYSGAPEGVGSSERWVSQDDKVGTGSMTIIAAEPFAMVRMRLDFEKPFAGTSQLEFGFRMQDEITIASWTMTGKSAFIPRLMCHLFFNMDKMMGDKFDEGLVSLKAVSEAPDKK